MIGQDRSGCGLKLMACGTHETVMCAFSAIPLTQTLTSSRACGLVDSGHRLLNPALMTLQWAASSKNEAPEAGSRLGRDVTDLATKPILTRYTAPLAGHQRESCHREVGTNSRESIITGCHYDCAHYQQQTLVHPTARAGTYGPKRR